MSHDALQRIAMGNDKEYYILTGGDDQRLQVLKQRLVKSCAMPHTAPLPAEQIRWRFPRYCLPVGAGAWYFDLRDLFEVQTPECESPFRLAATHNLMHRFIREKLRGGDTLPLGGAGYVRAQARGSALRFAGSHLNVSFTAPGLEGCRTALARDSVRHAMLFFFSTSQVWGGIGLHFAPEWEVRSRAIVTDISNNCVDNKGVLQPGRDIPMYEVKEAECLHYTHFEAGWARSEYQRALSAALVGIDAHLGCHHATEVLRFLSGRGVSVPPPQPWHTIRRALSRAFLPQLDHAVALGSASFTVPQLLDLRLDLYRELLPEAADIEWVAWAVAQVAALRDALTVAPGVAHGPLLGLDSVVKHELVFRPFAESRGFALEELYRHSDAYLQWLADPATSIPPEIAETMHDLLGLNLLYHDFSLPGLYEDLLETYPEVREWHTLAPVQHLAGEALPATRSRRRHTLMNIYAEVSAQSHGALMPCFAGFDRIALNLRANGNVTTQLHALPGVLEPRLGLGDRDRVRALAQQVGVDPEPVLSRYLAAGNEADAQPSLPTLA